MNDTSDTETKLVRYLCNVVWSILFEVYRPPDLEVGFTIQVGGLDEADLHSSKQNHVLPPVSQHHEHKKNSAKGGATACFACLSADPSDAAMQSLL